MALRQMGPVPTLANHVLPSWVGYFTSLPRFLHQWKGKQPLDLSSQCLVEVPQKRALRLRASGEFGDGSWGHQQISGDKTWMEQANTGG